MTSELIRILSTFKHQKLFIIIIKSIITADTIDNKDKTKPENSVIILIILFNSFILNIKIYKSIFPAIDTIHIIINSTLYILNFNNRKFIIINPIYDITKYNILFNTMILSPSLKIYPTIHPS